MTIQAISNFITVKNTSGVVQHRYQNAKVGEVIALDGFDFSYLSFLYQGATKNRTGDNLESELYLAPNAVAMNIAREAVVKNWIVQVDTCTMNPKTFAVGKKATSEGVAGSEHELRPREAGGVTEQRDRRGGSDNTDPQADVDDGGSVAIDRSNPEPLRPEQLVGLPFRLGACPRRHGATDCVGLARSVLAYYGIETPEPTRQWYRR